MEKDNHKAVAGKYLTFVLDGQGFGIPIQCVREINRVSEITHIPQTAKYVVGVINLRGKVIPVIDLRMRFDLEANPYDRETCIIVIEGKQGQVGTIVNAVRVVVELGQEHIENPPSVGEGMNNAAIYGIGKVNNNVILLINIDHVLDDVTLHGVAELVKSSTPESVGSH
jgi:purine-binding chemotaxis protein CheW